MALVSLRERMKQETSRTIARTAQDLVRDRGLNTVTVEEIARTAGVSERTFFNYFSCKEEAIVGVPEEVLVELQAALRARPGRERPLASLRAVFTAWLDQEVIRSRWALRYELVSSYPALIPQHLAALLEMESALSRSLAERMGVELAKNPSPRMFVSAALSALRAGMSWWEESGRKVSLSRVLDQAFNQMASPAPPRW